MSIKIQDENFPSADDLNDLDCVIADRFLNSVEDALSIVNVCQDIFNISLVVIDFTLTGTFKYSPRCQILEVDEEEYSDVFVPLVSSYYLSTPLPLTTNCNVLQGKLCFDFGSVISNFVSANTIKFKLILEGAVPQSYGVDFTPNNPERLYVWNKGRFPSPVNLTYVNGSLIAEFSNPGATDCSCNLTCSIPSGVDIDLTLCPDQKQSVVIYTGGLSGQAQYINLTFRDSIGNESYINIQSLIDSSILPLTVSHNVAPFRNDIFMNRTLINGDTISTDSQFQIWKYEGTSKNYKLWKDWSSRDWSYFVDYDIIPGQTYGYSVRFRGAYGDLSNFSTWTTVNT